jgi:hypothetical protein
VGVAMALGLGLLTAAPAAANHTVSIQFPGAASEFYSPFSGPATVTFTIDPTDVDATFNIRLRPAGETSIHSEAAFVDAQDADGTKVVAFTWPALSVNSPRTYEVAVYRVGGSLVEVQSFFLRPKLVSIGSATPNPFLPWIDDGIKDTTNVKFTLSADADAEARVYRPKTDGKCCGALVLNDNTGISGTLSAGTHTWNWDGQGEGAYAGNLPKGDYFVRIAATDTSAMTKTSKPLKVTIARTYRDRATMQKDGMLMHHTGPVTSYRRGGNCFVSKDGTDRDLWITCLSASFTVYWRWSLPTGGRIESASFVYVPGSSGVCNGKKGHTKIDSTLKVGGVGQFHCRVDKAKITYSRPVPS